MIYVFRVRVRAWPGLSRRSDLVNLPAQDLGLRSGFKFEPPDLNRPGTEAAVSTGTERAEAGMAETGHPRGGLGTLQDRHQYINGRTK